MKKIDPKKIEQYKPCPKAWTFTKPTLAQEARMGFYNAYNWVACVARGLLGATFHEGSRVRDGKTRIVVTFQDAQYECVVEEEDPTAVVRHLMDQENHHVES